MFIKFLALISATFGVLYGAWMLISTASQEIVIGRATVIDGDTFIIDGHLIRLHGAVAPEMRQVCNYEGRKWLCGSKAALELAAWLGDSIVVCRMRPTAGNHSSASCLKGISDAGRWLVRSGWAVADTCTTTSYVPEQSRARAAEIGIWASTFELPATFRVERSVPFPAQTC